MKLVTAAVFIGVAVSASAQNAQRSAQTSPPDPTAVTLGRGWTALGSGRVDDAVTAARQVLRSQPSNHDALSLAIAALSTRQESMAALDLYEQWLAASGHEDLFPLQPIAKAVLRTLSSSTDARIRRAALIARAEVGDPDALSTLNDESRSDNASLDVDAALAAAGDATAVRRLEARVTAGGTRDKGPAIQALVDAKASGSSGAIAQALKDPAPPSRMSAASALADLGAVGAIPPLKDALNDEDPAVRHLVQIALARLGDPAGGTALQNLPSSPVAEFRLLAARLAASQNPAGDWTTAVQPLLLDPDPMVRLQAAGLLLQYGHGAEAQATLDAALSDRTPFVRTQAARVLRSRLTAFDPNLAAIRRLLRDPLQDVQIEAARALLFVGQPARR